MSGVPLETLPEQPELKRVMGPGLLLLFIVGDILGTGIYALTGQVAAEVGGGRLAALPDRLRRRAADGAQLSRAGHQISACGRCGALYA
ncbi:hypothetical protein [Rhizobium sp. OAE497]|uniref:hypothetical protein n=1 Tax=Rhizobium sp. OAE497 TaxID=2663796 RepID=UPI0033920E5B